MGGTCLRKLVNRLYRVGLFRYIIDRQIDRQMTRHIDGQINILVNQQKRSYSKNVYVCTSVTKQNPNNQYYKLRLAAEKFVKFIQSRIEENLQSF